MYGHLSDVDGFSYRLEDYEYNCRTKPVTFPKGNSFKSNGNVTTWTQIRIRDPFVTLNEVIGEF